MKRLLYLLLIVTFVTPLNAQVTFSPPGARWHYLFHGANTMPYYQFNEKIEYVGDHIIGNELVKTLHHSIGFTMQSPNVYFTYIRQTGDTIWFWNDFTDSTWQVLYNFNCAVNDSWITTLNTGTEFTIRTTVLARSNTLVLGQSLKTMTVKIDPQQIYLKDTVTITERLGAEPFLFYYEHHYQIDGQMVAGPLCYSDSAFGTYQFSSLPCDYTNPTTVEDIMRENTAISIFPNPAADQITVSLPANGGSRLVRLRDLSGKPVLQTTVTLQNSVVELKSLKNGFYLLEVETDQPGASHFHKLVISR